MVNLMRNLTVFILPYTFVQVYQNDINMYLFTNPSAQNEGQFLSKI